MIVLDLCCDQAHRFEGWFASADAFEDQRERKLLSCPICATTSVRRLPSAPYVQTRVAASTAPPDTKTDGSAPLPTQSNTASSSISPATAAAVLQVLRHMSRHAENVGERLPEEARRIHYGEAEARNLRGQASAEEVEELLEEGITVFPLPPGEDEIH